MLTRLTCTTVKHKACRVIVMQSLHDHDDGFYFAVYFFFFKQNTAYESSECDWSSDVCSSDLKQKTAYEISECDWSSDVCSSDLMIRRPPRFLNVTGVQTCALPIFQNVTGVQ